MNTAPRRAWVVLMRVTPLSPWCAYGPATHREALEFRKRSTGACVVRQLAQLIPMPRRRTGGAG